MSVCPVVVVDEEEEEAMVAVAEGTEAEGTEVVAEKAFPLTVAGDTQEDAAPGDAVVTTVGVEDVVVITVAVVIKSGSSYAYTYLGRYVGIGFYM